MRMVQPTQPPYSPSLLIRQRGTPMTQKRVQNPVLKLISIFAAIAMVALVATSSATALTAQERACRETVKKAFLVSDVKSQVKAIKLICTSKEGAAGVQGATGA